MSPATSLPVAGSSATWPLRKSRSPARTAAEKGPTDGAIRSVVIISRRMSLISFVAADGPVRGRFGSHRYEGQFTGWPENGDQEVADLREQGGFLLLRRCIPDHSDINMRHLTHSVSFLGPKAADQQSTPMSWNINSLVSVVLNCASGAVGYDHERRSAAREFNP